MNDVMVVGGSPYKRTLAKKVINFCIDRMMSRMKTLEIMMYLENDMENADGYCLAETNRAFVLEIDSRLRGDNFITAITHEMTHVKQYARGETKDVDKLTKSWKGEEYICLYSTVEEYMNFPWEKEAYEMQEILLTKYKEFENN